jgi:hypothetical protein
MLAAWEAIKLFFSSAKNIVVVIFVLIILGLAGYGELKIYDAGKTSGATTQAAKDKKVTDADDKQIADLKAQVTTLQGQLATAKSTIQTQQLAIQTWTNKANKAEQDFQTLQNTTLKNLQNQLADSNKRLTAAQQLAASLQENNPYVTQTAALQCVIPVGFVQLFNGAVEDPTSTGIFTGSVPSSTLLGYGAPSGINLSQLSSVVVLDLSAAVQRGDQVRAWQTWYTQTKANWDQVLKTIRTTMPTLNQPNPPATTPPQAANDPAPAAAVATPKRSGQTGG